MALPPDIPTLKHSVTGRYSRLDNVFTSQSLADRLIQCDSLVHQRIACMDHFSIVSCFNLGYETSDPVTRHNFKAVDWSEFDKELRARTSALPPRRIQDTAEFDLTLALLTSAITDTIESQVPKCTITAYSKRWWTSELTALRNRRNNLANRASRHEDDEEDPVHAEFSQASRLYRRALETARTSCWEKFIDEVDGAGLWNAHRYLKNDPADGGASRIPSLTRKLPDGSIQSFDSNAEKSQILYETFFPTPAKTPIASQNYPEEVTRFKNITEQDVEEVISSLQPYKTPGPDGIPNCVFTNCRSTLIPLLLSLCRATFELDYYPDAWKTSTTVVLKKPEKPDYTTPKAYRPIALLNVMSKILSACVANRLNHIAERFNLLPDNHFGGRASRTTTDSMHLLTSFVKRAWRAKQVVSALFQDVSGAFPNASPHMLAHNMRKKGIPEDYVSWMERKLDGRTTQLKFDDFTSNSFEITHGIDQGCPLSCIYYIIYNSDLVSAASTKKADGELAVGYIDDVALLARADTFTEANKKLKEMMERRKGALSWARTHTSEFALEKTALVGFNRYSTKCRNMDGVEIGGTQIVPTSSHKFLGVHFDSKLLWREQRATILKSASKWAQLIGRVSKLKHGLKPHCRNLLRDCWNYDCGWQLRPEELLCRNLLRDCWNYDYGRQLRPEELLVVQH